MLLHGWCGLFFLMFVLSLCHLNIMAENMFWDRQIRAPFNGMRGKRFEDYIDDEYSKVNVLLNFPYNILICKPGHPCVF